MKKLVVVVPLMVILAACTTQVTGPVVEESMAAIPENDTAMAEVVEIAWFDADPAAEELAAEVVVDEDCPICGTNVDYDGPLTSQEVDGLLLALNDEYHAWAVYDQVIADFGEVRPFTNIRSSEQRHIDALVNLFETYDVLVPDDPWIGNVPSFDSKQAACQAGVDAEIANAALYDELFASTERSDILQVYEALQQASLDKHLRAFQRCAR